ncbi:DoxX family protein [Nocardia sp. XZ_19_385]|uniref:DoxX family protein n=1 Tax=Nocardia sp. XZ_19_385 TaxID=2769488 RepID=UPI00188F61C6|nr:DoxX family protein [Nocardia sp. XZ_19_385]
MSVRTVEPGLDAEEPERPEAERWKLITRILVRFGLMYFGLLALLSQVILEFPGLVVWWRPIAVEWPQPVVEWVGRTVFGTAVVRRDSGSGDTAYDWVLSFCILVIAVTVTAAWSVLDRKRTEYRTAAGWLLVFVRVCLAGTMLSYGFVKAFPLQMPSPSLTRLLEPFGDLTPMGVLWSQVGVSPVYESLLGIAEILCGVLLLVPRTAVAGALLTVVSAAQVWILNMTYDVPVKILSFHVLLMALVLVAPEAYRITAVLLGNAAGPSTAPQPFRTSCGRRVVARIQVGLLVWLIVVGTVNGVVSWQQRESRSELYGIWEVSAFTRDGQSVPALLGDGTRWRRVVFEQRATADIQTMDDRFQRIRAEISDDAQRLMLRSWNESDSAAPWASFTVEGPAPNRLRLNGELDGHPVTVELTRYEADHFTLRQSGFHWVTEFPNNNCVSGRPACPTPSESSTR